MLDNISHLMEEYVDYLGNSCDIENPKEQFLSNLASLKVTHEGEALSSMATLSIGPLTLSFTRVIVGADGTIHLKNGMGTTVARVGSDTLLAEKVTNFVKENDIKYIISELRGE